MAKVRRLITRAAHLLYLQKVSHSIVVGATGEKLSAHQTDLIPNTIANAHTSARSSSALYRAKSVINRVLRGAVTCGGGQRPSASNRFARLDSLQHPVMRVRLVAFSKHNVTCSLFRFVHLSITVCLRRVAFVVHKTQKSDVSFSLKIPANAQTLPDFMVGAN